MFGDNLQKLRKASKMSQEVAAEKLGTTVRTYGSWERNEREPDFQILCKVADLFAVTTDLLLGRTSVNIDIKKEAPPPLGEGEQEFVIDLDGAELPGSEFEKRVLQILSQELDRRGI